MALSGSFNTTAYSNRHLTFKWSCKTQSTANNYSVIDWELLGAGTATGYLMSAPFKVEINSSVVYESSTRIELRNGTKVASGQVTLKHNDNGTFTMTAKVTAAIYSYSNNVSGSGSWALDTIPRAATITNAPDFNDEANPVLQYTNAAGNNVSSLQACISFTGATPDIAYRDITKTGTSYTFNLTDAERNVLRNSIPTANSRKLFFYIKTVISGVTYYSKKEVTFTIINANPTINPSITDGNTIVSTITGDKNTLVKYYSNAVVKVNAVAQKGATIQSIVVRCGGKSLSGDGTINNVESGTFKIGVTDSRGNSIIQTVNKTFIDYVKPTINLVTSNMTTDGSVILTFTGTFYNGKIGKFNNKDYLDLGYYLWGNDPNKEDDYDFFTDVEDVSVSGNTYVASVTLTGFNYQSEYTIQGQMIDIFDDVYTEVLPLLSKPVFEWGKDVFCINAEKTEGNLYGLGRLEQIPSGANLNDYKTVGCYAVVSNANASGITNIPIALAGKLIVTAATGNNVTGAYAYIQQEYIPLYPDQPTYKRLISSGAAAGNWTYNNWCRDKGDVILWEGVNLMDGNSPITLNQLISAQPNGIVLRFCKWNGTSAEDNNLVDFFVAKSTISKHDSKGRDFFMTRRKCGAVTTKYLYITDNKISGHADNVLSGTANGITYDNTAFCLCEVIGV